MATMRSINPATGEQFGEFETLTDHDLDELLGLAHETARTYRTTSFAERATWMRRAADLLDSERRQFAEMMTREMGKPIGAAEAEAAKCALTCRFYAEHAESMLARESVAMDEGENWVAFEPLGVVLAVMPWNFPFWQVIRFAAPALMAGNVGVLKHASNVPQCALALQDLFRRAGFPQGAFQTALIGSDKVEFVIADPRVAAVTLTGSEGAGKAVAGAAGRVLKKSVVELGGSDPFIVMPSADMQRVVDVAVQARIINNGQSCIAAKRFIVHKAIAKPFTEQFVAAMQRIVIGDPMDPATQLGPLATESIVHDLADQVQRTIDLGATVLTGGDRLDRPGNFYAPTVLSNVPLESPAQREELFGPVAPILVARDTDEALNIANASIFGLGAAAWTNDSGEQERFVRELEAGTVVINGMVASDPRMPFGGIKRSGYGRELSAFGIREFVNIKSVRVLQGGSAHATE